MIIACAPYGATIRVHPGPSAGSLLEGSYASGWIAEMRVNDGKTIATQPGSLLVSFSRLCFRLRLMAVFSAPSQDVLYSLHGGASPLVFALSQDRHPLPQSSCGSGLTELSCDGNQAQFQYRWERQGRSRAEAAFRNSVCTRQYSHFVGLGSPGFCATRIIETN